MKEGGLCKHYSDKPKLSFYNPGDVGCSIGIGHSDDIESIGERRNIQCNVFGSVQVCSHQDFTGYGKYFNRIEVINGIDPKYISYRVWIDTGNVTVFPNRGGKDEVKGVHLL